MVLHDRCSAWSSLELREGRSWNLEQSFKVYSYLGLDIVITEIRLHITRFIKDFYLLSKSAWTCLSVHTADRGELKPQNALKRTATKSLLIDFQKIGHECSPFTTCVMMTAYGWVCS